MRYVPVIDEGACIAQGDCTELAPEIFELDGNVVRVIGEGDSALLLAAAEECPTGAIAVLDAETGEQVFP
jgi:ferredoxin